MSFPVTGPILAFGLWSYLWVVFFPPSTLWQISKLDSHPWNHFNPNYWYCHFGNHRFLISHFCEALSPIFFPFMQKEKKGFLSFNLVKHIMQMYGFYVRWWPAAISPLAPAVISLDLPARTGWGLLSTGCKTSRASQVLPSARQWFSRWPPPLWVSTHGMPEHDPPAEAEVEPRSPCAQASEHPRICHCPHITAQRAKRFQGENLEVFKKVTRENIYCVLNNPGTQCCLKQSKQLIMLSAPPMSWATWEKWMERKYHNWFNTFLSPF